MNDDVNRHPFSSNHDSDPLEGVHPSVEQLSEYLDGSMDIDDAERHAIEGHLTGCQACQAVLDDLRMVVQTLNTLPVREAPRSYAITHDMLEPATPPAAPQPVVLQESAQWHARHAGKVRWATAVAAMLFVFVISADLVTNGIRPLSSGVDDSASDTTMMRESMDGEESEESIGAMSADEPEPIPTAATGEEAELESGSMPAEEEAPESESIPPVAEEEAEEEAAVPEDAEEPASDDAEADQPEDTTAQSDDEDAAGEGDGDEDVSAFSIEEEAISDEPASETAAAGEESSQLRWRVVEVTLALVLALLLAVMIGLPTQRGARRR